MIKILISYEKYREAEKREAASLPFLLAEAACGQHKDGLNAAQGAACGQHSADLQTVYRLQVFSLRPLCPLHDGCAVFGGRHIGDFLKLPGKIVHRGIAQGIRDLGKVHLLVSDHLFGSAYLHLVETFHHAAFLVGSEQLFELRHTDQVVTAYLFHGELPADMPVQVVDNAGKQFIPIRESRGTAGIVERR